MLKKSVLLLLSGLNLIFLSSCISTKASETQINPVYVTNNAKYYLLPTEDIENPINGVQKMSATFKDQSFDFVVYTTADQTVLNMILFNEFGTTLGSLEYDGSTISFDSSIFPKNMKAEYIAADFQFCLYNPEKIAAALKEIGLDFRYETTESGETRQIYSNDELVSTITKDGNVIRYDNLLRGYSYTLTSELSADEL